MSFLYILIFFGSYTLFSVYLTTIRVYHNLTSFFKKSRNRSQWLRCRAPTLLPQTVSVVEILSEYLPPDVVFPCRYGLFVKNRQCSRYPSKEHRNWACLTYNALVGSRPNKQYISDMLNDCAGYCLCHQHRQKIMEDTSFWNGQVEIWKAELTDLYNEEINRVLKELEEREMEDVQGQTQLISLFSTLIVRSSLSSPTMHQPTFNIPGTYLPSRTNTMSDDDFTHSKEDRANAASIVQKSYKEKFILVSNQISDDPPPSNSGVSVDEEPIAMFTEYSPTTESMFNLIVKPLGLRDIKKGYIYVFHSQTGNPQIDTQYVKIGVTENDIGRRVAEYSSNCGQTFESVGAFKTPNAERVEKLVHKELELRMKRRKNHYCVKNRNRCTKTHIEWFEIHKDEAVQVIEYWIFWMNTFEPYDSEGQLRSDLVGLMYGAELEDPLKTASQAHSFMFNSQGEPWHSSEKAGQRRPPVSQLDGTGPASTALDKDISSSPPAKTPKQKTAVKSSPQSPKPASTKAKMPQKPDADQDDRESVEQTKLNVRKGRDRRKSSPMNGKQTNLTSVKGQRNRNTSELSMGSRKTSPRMPHRGRVVSDSALWTGTAQSTVENCFLGLENVED